MHRISQAIEELGAVLKGVSDAHPVFMTTEEKHAAILGLKRLESQVLELRLRVAAEAQDVVDRECAKHIGAVLVAAGLDEPTHAHREVQLMRALTRYEQVRAGMAAGEVTRAHAEVIAKTLEALPDEVGPEVLARAEVDLCGHARGFTPAQLRVLGQGILTRVDPEHGEEIEARWIRSLEEAAEQKITLGLKRLGDGTSTISARVSDALGIRFLTVLESHAQPRKAALDADGRVRPRGRLLFEALESLLEHIDPTLPAHGGDATTVIVTVPLELMRSELGLATMADGTLLTAGEARRLACTANIIPAVLGGNSEVLDLGRAKRLFSPGQRKALGIRDQHCRAEGCQVPATWCDAHHVKPWSQGGKTDLATGILLCGHHHRSIDDPEYESTRIPNGDIRFHRRR